MKFISIYRAFINWVKSKAKTHIFALFFAGAVFINYWPDLAPYYVQRLFSHDLKILGTPRKFEEKCASPDSGEWKCWSEYRLPNRLIKDKESIGFGIVLFPLVAFCEDKPNEKISLSEMEDGDRVTSYLKTYQTLNLTRLKCTSDLIVENWSDKIFHRHGYSQGLLTVGSEPSIRRVKAVVEFSIMGVLACSAFVFILLYSMFGMLGRVTGIKLVFPPFDGTKFFWLAFILFANGIFFETIFPYQVPFQLVAKASNFFGMMCISGPTLVFMAMEEKLPKIIRKVAFLLTSTPRFGILPLLAISGLVVGHPYFGFTYPYAILILSILCLSAAGWSRDWKMIFFALCLLSDGFKISMVPYLPASRETVTYMIFILSYELFRRIKVLEKNAAFGTGTEIALSVAHDIRSPLTTLRTIAPSLNGPDDLKKMFAESVERITSIANDLLVRSSGQLDPFRKVKAVDVTLALEEVVNEAKEKMRDGGRIISLLIEQRNLRASVSEMLFKRVVANLIDNAIDATSAGEGRIDIRLSAKMSKIELVFSDNGIGIRPEILKNLGTIGISSKKQGPKSGSGIGFYIVKKAIRDFGGEILVNSIEGTGTEVTVWLPVEA